MALFQKKPIEISQPVQYSVSFNTKTVLIVGLGNPGLEYKNTRHNIGFVVLDAFAKNNDFPAFKDVPKFKGATTEKLLGQTKVILLKPNTYMNNSGEAVQSVANYLKIEPSQIVVVHDDLDINFGQIRMRSSGQSAGNNGVKSLIHHISQDFGRIRVGIADELSPKIDAADFVLGKFTRQQQEHMPDLVNEASNVITEFVYGGQLPHETRSIII